MIWKKECGNIVMEKEECLHKSIIAMTSCIMKIMPMLIMLSQEKNNWRIGTGNGRRTWLQKKILVWLIWRKTGILKTPVEQNIIPGLLNAQFKIVSNRTGCHSGQSNEMSFRPWAGIFRSSMIIGTFQFQKTPDQVRGDIVSPETFRYWTVIPGLSNV